MAFPLSQVMYDRLAGDATLVAMLGEYGGAPAIFTDPIPSDLHDFAAADPPPWPFLVLSRSENDIDNGCKDRDGREVRRQVRCYHSAGLGTSGSMVPLEDVAERVRDLFHRRQLVIAGWDPYVSNCQGPREAPTSKDFVGLAVEVEISALAVL